MNTDEIADSLERCFISPNVADSNMEPANVVDVIDRAARNLSRIAHAITPTDAAAMQTPYGGRVGSLTEAVIYAADSLTKIAEAIGDLASAVRERDAQRKAKRRPARAVRLSDLLGGCVRREKE